MNFNNVKVSLHIEHNPGDPPGDYGPECPEMDKHFYAASISLPDLNRAAQKFFLKEAIALVYEGGEPGEEGPDGDTQSYDDWYDSGTPLSQCAGITHHEPDDRSFGEYTWWTVDSASGSYFCEATLSERFTKEECQMIEKAPLLTKLVKSGKISLD